MPASAEPEVAGHGLSRREKAAQALEPLVQVVPEEKRRLTGFILLALLAHVALFYGIKLTYPKTTRQPAPRVRAMLAFTDPAAASPADSEAGDREFWNRLHDPSMLILPQDKLDADLAAMRAPRANEAETLEPDAVTDLPSLMQPVDPRDGVPGLPAAPRGLEARVSAQLTPLPQPFIFPREAAEAPIEETTIKLSGPLASRRWALAPDLPEPETEVLPPRGTTTLRLGVDAAGDIVHLLVVEGSGNAAMDQIGLEAVRRGRFAPQQLNLPAQPARQKWRVPGSGAPFPGLSWPAASQPKAVPEVHLQGRTKAPADDLTWGEAKLYWRLRGPEQAGSGHKAGPEPPEEDAP